MTAPGWEMKFFLQRDKNLSEDVLSAKIKAKVLILPKKCKTGRNYYL